VKPVDLPFARRGKGWRRKRSSGGGGALFHLAPLAGSGRTEAGRALPDFDLRKQRVGPIEAENRNSNHETHENSRKDRGMGVFRRGTACGNDTSASFFIFSGFGVFRGSFFEIRVQAARGGWCCRCATRR
jgi:hypothetical protein